MQPGYPQLRTCKNNCVFSYFFKPHFSSVIYSTCFLIAWSHREWACIFIHSHRLPFKNIKLADFIVPEAILIPLLTFERVHFAKFHFHHCVFPRNTGLGTDILFINWSYFARSLVKKSIPDWHLFITQMETKWTKLYAMTSHVIAYPSQNCFSVRTHFILIAFLRILIAYLRKYAACLGCCTLQFFCANSAGLERNSLIRIKAGCIFVCMFWWYYCSIILTRHRCIISRLVHKIFLPSVGFRYLP